MLKYYENIDLFNFKESLNDYEKIIAHITEDKRVETLEEHSSLCIKYLEKIISKKKLENVLLNFEEILLPDITMEKRLLYREMLYHTIFLHDLGKINCNFQYYKMKNDYFKNICTVECNNSNHSMLSALIYINEFNTKISKFRQDKETAMLVVFLLLNAYVISKHHGNFDSFEEFIKKIIEPDGEMTRLYSEQTVIFEKIYNEQILKNKTNRALEGLINVMDIIMGEASAEFKEISIDYYIYIKFMSSLLLSCDFYATTEFINGKETNSFGEIEGIKKFYEVYKNNHIYKSIRAYEEKEYENPKDFDCIKDINILRNELFIDAERCLNANSSEDIYFLEAPTGSGKSMVSFNLALKMLEQSNNLNRIFYIYPFNTLIEQNMNTLKEIFKGSDLIKDISVINSLVPMKKVNNADYIKDGEVINYQNIDYIKSLLDRQFLHYPIVLTTHVSMFRFLFATEKEALFPLAQISNSVLIFDEIQSYKNSIWKEIITFLNHYAKMLNVKILIMSATLPNLCKLIDTDVKSINLIENRDKYFLNPIFKDRVELDFSLMEYKENIMEILEEHVSETSKKNNINILIEFITKNSAKKFYELLCNSEKIANKEIRLITGEDSSYERNKIVEEFKNNKNIILVATQVIEAGVDLDSNIGYKDISLFDSEEQFTGRINRHFSKENEKGTVYFFNLDSANLIYKGDVRKEKTHTLENQNIREILKNKDFATYYSEILNHLINRSDIFDKFLNEKIKKLNFNDIEKRMSLIDERFEYSIFLNREIRINDSEILNGEDVWDNYVKLLKDEKLEYAQKRVELFDASVKLSHFIYKTKKLDFEYEQRIGDLFYINDGEKYFENGKFISEKFENNRFI